MSDKFNEIYQKSINNPEKFWKDASEDIFWFEKPNKILGFAHRTAAVFFASRDFD